MATDINNLDYGLKLVDQMIIKDLQVIKKKETMELLNFKADKIADNNNFYPLLLLLSYYLFKKDNNIKAISMAAIIKYIYLASEIHKYEGNNPEYHVLIGDYYYSKFFQYLCQYDMLEWLIPISQTICTMQLGSIEKIDNNHALNSIIECVSKENAVLGEISCQMGATIAKAPGLAIKKLKEIGYNLGLVFGLMQNNNIPHTQILKYIEDLEEHLNILRTICAYKENLYMVENIINNIKTNLIKINVKVG